MNDPRYPSTWTLTQIMESERREELLAARDEAHEGALRRIGQAIGYGNAQHILGRLWDEMLEADYGISGRGPMGVTVDDALPPIPRSAAKRRQMAPHGGYEMVPAYSVAELTSFAHAAMRRNQMVTPWRIDAANWLRRKAEAAVPASEQTGWANPAYAEPDRLVRLAEALEGEQAGEFCCISEISARLARGIGAEGRDAQRLGAQPAEPGPKDAPNTNEAPPTADERAALAAECKRLVDEFSDAVEQEGRDYLAKGQCDNWRPPTFAAYNALIAAIDRLAGKP